MQNFFFLLFKSNNSAGQLETRPIAVTPYNHIYFHLTVLELRDPDYFYKYTYKKVTSYFYHQLIES